MDDDELRFAALDRNAQGDDALSRMAGVQAPSKRGRKGRTKVRASIALVGEETEISLVSDCSGLEQSLNKTGVLGPGVYQASAIAELEGDGRARAPIILAHRHELASETSRQPGDHRPPGSTRADAGLRVRAEIDRSSYPKGVVVTDDQMNKARLQPHQFHGEWNNTIRPKRTQRK